MVLKNMPHNIVLHNPLVLHNPSALWLACVHAAASHTIHLQLITQPIQSLSSLRQAQPQLTSIIVAAGAAVGLLPELGVWCIGGDGDE